MLVKEIPVTVELHRTTRAGLRLGVKIQIYLFLRFNWSWYSVVSIVAGLRAGGFEVRIPVKFKSVFSKTSRPALGSTNLLFSAYWGLFS
jgi:hypothetical protein